MNKLFRIIIIFVILYYSELKHDLTREWLESTGIPKVRSNYFDVTFFISHSNFRCTRLLLMLIFCKNDIIKT